MIWRRYIPFENIFPLQALGTVYQTSTISGGENITYRGISINGIGFGEFEYDPIKIEQKLHDTRVLALYYKDSIDQALFFPQDALSTLINLISLKE